jgi:hypothetical protein
MAPRGAETCRSVLRNILNFFNYSQVHLLVLYYTRSEVVLKQLKCQVSIFVLAGSWDDPIGVLSD